MERLTFDGNFCDIAQCRETPGGSFCENGTCSQKEVWLRLKDYEDTGLTPEQCENAKVIIEAAFSDDTSKAERIRELLKADKEGRLAVLPCKVGGSMLNAIDIERPEIMKGLHFAVAYVCGGIVFHQPYNIFLENIAAGYIRPLNDAEKALEAMKDE